MGKLHDFLGMKTIKTNKTRNIWIGQQVYANIILQKFGTKKLM